MASAAEEFKAFEAAGWSRRANTYARVTGAITARFVDALLDAACVRDSTCTTCARYLYLV